MSADTPNRYVLLNPGPVTLTESVRQSQLQRDMCHRETAFAELMADVRGRLCQIYELDAKHWSSVLIAGSGTAAVESMITSIVSGESSSLVCANGVYGERMANMLSRCGKKPVVVRSEWQEPLDFEAVESALQQSGSLKHVIAVHHETTTGRLNDLDRLGSLCSKYNRRLLIDGVSSFGGETINFEDWPIDAVAATSNKCLHGITGTAFVVARRSVLEALPESQTSLYLDLGNHFAAQEKGFPAFTPAIQSIYALQQALVELASTGGWRQRNEVYRSRSERVRLGLDALRVKPFLHDFEAHSAILTSYRLPAGIDYSDISNPLQDERIVIYAGQKELESIIFRIAVMGDLADQDLDRLLDVIAHNLR